LACQRASFLAYKLIRLVSSSTMSSHRENSVYLAKLAEQAERYEGTQSFLSIRQ